MLVTLLGLALQLQLTPTGVAQGTPARPPVQAAVDEDSLRDIARAHDAQAGFERGRRYLLPWSFGYGGRCDVRVGRFCWWYEDGQLAPPEEPPVVAQRREELLAELDAIARRRPADQWVAGMRVYYRVDNRQVPLADSAARECRSAAWWCGALNAYVAQARGNVALADSGFSAAIAAMPDSTRCAWTDISSLLPGDARSRYERLSCADRAAMESRYWLLGMPRLGAPANEWRTEFNARRVVTTLLASAVTPHRLGWGKDTEELLLRYGWPVAWSLIRATSAMPAEPEVLGHDPSPSFQFGPREKLDELAEARDDDGWDLLDIRAQTRFAHHDIKRVLPATVQLARFRRGDSTLVVAAWTSADDSLGAPSVKVGAADAAGRNWWTTADSSRTGRGQLMMPGVPALAGVELSDSASGTLARSRSVFPLRRDTSAIFLSDLLVFRPDSQDAPALTEAAARAIAGDSASLSQPIGLYWESYGAGAADSTVETTVLVERTDKGVFRGIRQRLGLADPDSPVQVRWNEALPATGGARPRSLSLDLSRLPAGRYRISVAVAPVRGAGATTSREIELKER